MENYALLVYEIVQGRVELRDDWEKKAFKLPKARPSNSLRLIGGIQRRPAETEGERAARVAFEVDLDRPRRIPTLLNGRRCAWEALVCSWDYLRREIGRRVDLELGIISINELDEVFARLSRENPLFQMDNTNMFRVD